MSAEAMIARAKERHQQGDNAAAEATYAAAAALAIGEGSARLRAHALRHVAQLAAERGAGERALEAADLALTIYRANPADEALNIANSYRVRALALSVLGRTNDAAHDWHAARKLYEQLGIRAGVAECDRRLGSG